MDNIDFPKKLESAKDLGDIFELVKKAVKKVTGEHRAGLMLGLADLGEGKNAWIGGFHIISSNSIIMNLRPLEHIQKNNPELYKPYAFVILLHEFIHTFGIISEHACRAQTLEIAKECFGNHLVTDLATDISKYLPYLSTAQYGWQPTQNPEIYYISDFDRSSMSYFV